MSKTKKIKPKSDGNLRDFLKEEGLYNKVAIQAKKEIAAWNYGSNKEKKDGHLDLR